MTTEEATYQLFANGFEYESWLHANCNTCGKEPWEYWHEHDEECNCDIFAAVLDGQAGIEAPYGIAKRMGYLAVMDQEPRRLYWPCLEKAIIGADGEVREPYWPQGVPQEQARLAI